MPQFTQCSVKSCICLYIYKRTAQTSFGIFLQIRIMIDDAKFNIHDSDSHFKKSTFKNGYWKKNVCIFVSWSWRRLKMATERKMYTSL